MLKDGAAGMWVWARFVPYSLSFLLAVAQLVSSCSGALTRFLAHPCMEGLLVLVGGLVSG